MIDDYDYETSPPCSHCGWRDRDMWERDDRDGDTDDTTCGSCAKPITITCRVQWDWMITPRTP